MILKALADYYQRLANDPNVDIAPPGFERKAIDFLVVLNPNGAFEDLLDIRGGVGRKRKGRVSLVPKGVKRSSGIAANLLWDNAAYIFGVKPSGPERGDRQKEAFRKKIEQTFSSCSDVGIQAVKSFLRRADFDPVFSHVAWSDLEESGGNISFLLSGEKQLICQRPDVVDTILEKAKPLGKAQLCSVSGEKDIPAELHTSIKGVWGAQSSGANIVSFNLDSFRSFGKKKGFNAPVGQTVEFAYTTALNHLLSTDNQRMQVGDASTVFWAKNPCDFEADFHPLLAPKKGEEAVSYDKIRSLLAAVKSGIPPEEADMPFYVLGLAPNASRIAIRFWHQGNVGEIKERIAEHFQDMEMTRPKFEKEYLSTNDLLLATTRHSAQHPYGDSADILPHLAGEVFDAVLKGHAYPRTLLQKVVNRAKAEQALCDRKGKRLDNVTYARVALLKAFFARNARLSRSTQKEVSMALDRTYDNIGYVLGRLFAVLERVQEEAHKPAKLNRTIRDTYFGGASSSPLVIFKRLDNLAIHHLAKMRNSGKNTTWLEKMLGEVKNLMPKEGVPHILSLEDQGRFSIGYYHQRQDFFTKHATEDKGE